MPDFSELFLKSNGHPVSYNGKSLVLSDKFPVEDGDILVVLIEKSGSKYRQGLCIDITGSCEMDGKIFAQGKGVRMLFWEDTSPKQFRIRVFTKRGFVWIENIWEQINSYLIRTSTGEVVRKESKSVESRYHGAAMIIEEIENGRRYRCNDGHPDENFDDIVFTVQRLPKVMV